jgi:hypothetical protein
MNRAFLVVATLLCLSSVAYALDEREGFVRQLEASSDVLVVPQGKRLVILQILTRDPYYEWNLEVDGNPFLNHNIFGYRNITNTGLAANLDVTFPDRCVTVEQGQTLSFADAWEGASVTIIGYLYNFYCESYPLSDLNKDCKVDLADMAIMASEWLKDNAA